ncbi:MAG: hypothetical protein OIF58_16555, partial [Cohaesibacter sp.]|nr:hypothetical protein [Cohaesibacter sp.]
TSTSCQALSTISSVFAANQICKMHKLHQARINCIKCNIVPDYKMHQADSSREPHKKHQSTCHCVTIQQIIGTCQETAPDAISVGWEISAARKYLSSWLSKARGLHS